MGTDEFGRRYVIRFVVTHQRHGARRLAHAQQGRCTYATKEEAQHWIDTAIEVNSVERLNDLFGLPLEVRPCRCYPVHFDPMQYSFED